MFPGLRGFPNDNMSSSADVEVEDIDKFYAKTKKKVPSRAPTEPPRREVIVLPDSSQLYKKVDDVQKTEMVTDCVCISSSTVVYQIVNGKIKSPQDVIVERGKVIPNPVLVGLNRGDFLYKLPNTEAPCYKTPVEYVLTTNMDDGAAFCFDPKFTKSGQYVFWVPYVTPSSKDGKKKGKKKNKEGTDDSDSSDDEGASYLNNRADETEDERNERNRRSIASRLQKTPIIPSANDSVNKGQKGSPDTRNGIYVIVDRRLIPFIEFLGRHMRAEVEVANSYTKKFEPVVLPKDVYISDYVRDKLIEGADIRVSVYIIKRLSRQGMTPREFTKMNKVNSDPTVFYRVRVKLESLVCDLLNIPRPRDRYSSDIRAHHSARYPNNVIAASHANSAKDQPLVVVSCEQDVLPFVNAHLRTDVDGNEVFADFTAAAVKSTFSNSSSGRKAKLAKGNEKYTEYSLPDENPKELKLASSSKGKNKAGKKAADNLDADADKKKKNVLSRKATVAPPPPPPPPKAKKVNNRQESKEQSSKPIDSSSSSAGGKPMLSITKHQQALQKSRLVSNEERNIDSSSSSYEKHKESIRKALVAPNTNGQIAPPKNGIKKLSSTVGRLAKANQSSSSSSSSSSSEKETQKRKRGKNESSSDNEDDSLLRDPLPASVNLALRGEISAARASAAKYFSAPPTQKKLPVQKEAASKQQKPPVAMARLVSTEYDDDPVAPPPRKKKDTGVQKPETVSHEKTKPSVARSQVQQKQPGKNKPESLASKIKKLKREYHAQAQRDEDSDSNIFNN